MSRPGSLFRHFCEFPAELGDILLRRRPVSIAGIAVEHHVAGLQLILELLFRKGYGLVVVVRAVYFELHAVVTHGLDSTRVLSGKASVVASDMCWIAQRWARSACGGAQ